jgi:SAM-dependent methyltransferase
MRVRSLSFGSVAERYDRARPSYPDELVDRLLSDGVTEVLDIGCGTGKASRMFAARGRDVLGVEADERMADYARSHGIDVEISSFEAWDPGGRTFDLVVCAQAWHWVDPAQGVPKLAEVLRPQARFAAFWNTKEPDELNDEIGSLYERLAPEIWAEREREHRDYADELEASEALNAVESWSFDYTRTYTRDEWLDLIGTYSDHIMLPDDRREELLSAVGAVIDENGGVRNVPYSTKVVTALRV